MSELERSISSRPYREVTVATMVLGIVSGIVLTASMTYAGLVIGFVVPASAIAAILGWGLLRGIMGRGSIVENNINQTVASAINNTSAGVIFTFPALFLMDNVEFNSVAIALAAIAGAFLGTLFIIPLRKQMIELERLRFPQGIAVAEVLRSSGAGLRKSMLLIVSTLIALGIGLTISFLVEFEVWDNDKLVLGDKLGLPAYVPVTLAVSLLSLGAGYITGRPGLVVLVGGVLANWVIGPLVVELGWVSPPEGLSGDKANAALAGMLAGDVNRPLGIGFLIGGALAGVALAAPMMRAAFASLRSPRGGTGGAGEEMSIKWMYYGMIGAIVLLGVSAYIEDPDIGIVRLLGTAVVGTLWMWLAGVIVAQCAGMTGWSPVSGMALLAVAVVLLMTQGAIAISVLIGAAVCVAISQGSDMMSDLKTGHLVGSRPAAQQITQVAVSWIGPGVAVVIVYLIWTTVGFGPANPSVPAPQAVTLQNVIAAVQGGDVPVDKYAVGGLVSAGLTLAVGGGVGVLVGLSMYLPIFYILPYGIGCVLAMITDRTLGRSWTVDTGIPIAAGLLVGDSLAGVAFSIYKLVVNL
jgi:putative OPT family oligopeptide transporter